MHLNICVWLLLASICTVVKSYNVGQNQNCRYKTFHQFQLMPRKIFCLEAVILCTVLNRDSITALNLPEQKKIPL